MTPSERASLERGIDKMAANLSKYSRYQSPKSFMDTPAFPLLAISVIVVGGSVGYYFYNKSKNTVDTSTANVTKKVTTEVIATEGLKPEQAKIYTSALQTIKDPVKLETLATAFKQAGKPEQAKVLEKRAAVSKLPKSQQQERKTVLQKALSSKKPDAIRSVAKAFAGEGCVGAAGRLNEYASALETLAS
jgi:hypothetical protein